MLTLASTFPPELNGIHVYDELRNLNYGQRATCRVDESLPLKTIIQIISLNEFVSKIIQ